ncbi:putative Tetratricopeptide repeat-like superfamily protein [Quillaja saponaria]|uniref:Tetratricopeptide repeat-like superfamily protein n=1 Tax=Quillaja saponaria TaxID=32244 RepID=A0AAD7LKM2_QUISA|nr:putative Tetratricopeptide repeat-like superfamily protein [Quillaja saponaria]
MIRVGNLKEVGVKRSCVTNFDEFYGNEITKQVEGLAKKFDLSDQDYEEYRGVYNSLDVDRGVTLDILEPSLLGIQPESPDWPERDKIVRVGIERKANSLELPLTLRIIKRKQQWQEGFKEAGEFTYCSVKKAFSSIVFIIQELQSYALHLRESLYCEDLQGVMAKNENENATLVGVNKDGNGGTLIPAKRVIHFPNLVPDDISEVSLYGDKQLTEEEEMKLWSMVEEASRLEEVNAVALDTEIKQQFVSPLTVQLEADDHEDYLRTDLLYLMDLSQEPNNPLLLSNYAQFLYLVAHDRDRGFCRAEEFFRHAVQLEPLDAEALSRYADFWWMERICGKQKRDTSKQ